MSRLILDFLLYCNIHEKYKLRLNLVPLKGEINSNIPTMINLFRFNLTEQATSSDFFVVLQHDNAVLVVVYQALYLECLFLFRFSLFFHLRQINLDGFTIRCFFQNAFFDPVEGHVIVWRAVDEQF